MDVRGHHYCPPLPQNQTLDHWTPPALPDRVLTQEELGLRCLCFLLFRNITEVFCAKKRFPACLLLLFAVTINNACMYNPRMVPSHPVLKVEATPSPKRVSCPAGT